MKLRALYLDDNVAVPGWTRVAGGVNTGRDSSFDAAEGWDIERIEPGVYQLMREGMPEPVRVEGYGASYVVLRAFDALYSQANERELTPEEKWRALDAADALHTALETPKAKRGKR